MLCSMELNIQYMQASNRYSLEFRLHMVALVYAGTCNENLCM
ncbi:hypothetical protein APHNYW_0336 [Anaplasma phagocytophilum str. ApNYW]|nr:hypothetical protein APHWEB_0135 [Anaplasma phagocytophilum str. Webster]KJV87940.1 hypothetical protein APHNYW_0336 [Anaplasma phagocytophilum str. ApNYW]